MKIIPAVDIQKGKCVRLLRGDFESSTVYGDSPYLVAKEWVRQGANMVHVVDLDAAEKEKFVNLEIIKKIVSIPNTSVQYGGGVRTKEDVQLLFSLGVSRVIISSSILENSKLVTELIKDYGKRIMISFDGKDGYLVTNGWKNNSGKRLLDVIAMARTWGITECIYTDTMSDGTLSINKKEVSSILEKSKMKTIIAGGVRDINDIKWLKENGAAGVILGRALYEKTVSLKEALRIC
ncbi:MAG: 1-(5-phosphoribosyl)-5-[(5-phosphoribosylamino)methylideneamino]imidazole-4-carboxamide isomerase [Microgenomates group bacterium]